MGKIVGKDFTNSHIELISYLVKMSPLSLTSSLRYRTHIYFWQIIKKFFLNSKETFKSGLKKYFKGKSLKKKYKKVDFGPNLTVYDQCKHE